MGKAKRGGEEGGWRSKSLQSEMVRFPPQAQPPAAAAREAGGSGEGSQGGADEDESGEGAEQEHLGRVLQAARGEGLVRRRRVISCQSTNQSLNCAGLCRVKAEPDVPAAPGRSRAADGRPQAAEGGAQPGQAGAHLAGRRLLQAEEGVPTAGHHHH